MKECSHFTRMEVKDCALQEFSLDRSGYEEQSCDLRWLVKLKVLKIDMLGKGNIMQTNTMRGESKQSHWSWFFKENITHN